MALKRKICKTFLFAAFLCVTINAFRIGSVFKPIVSQSLLKEVEINDLDEKTDCPLIDLKSSSKIVNISDVPYYDQLVYYWCGPACLQMVYDYWGENISQLEICDVARTEPNEGTWECDMRRATHFSNLSTSVGNEIDPQNITGYENRSYGYISFEQQFQNASDLRYLIDEGYPIIVLQWMTDSKVYGHYRVVIGYKTYENGSIDKFITYDPWPAFGPVVEFSYSKFVEYWAFSSNWSLFISPLLVSVSSPSKVEKDKYFTVEAEIDYYCPIYSKEPYLYNLTYCNASINLPEGYSLDSGENEQKMISDGDLKPSETATIKWEVKSEITGSNAEISIEVEALIKGSTHTHPTSPAPGYNYTDVIKGFGYTSSSIYEEEEEGSEKEDETPTEIADNIVFWSYLLIFAVIGLLSLIAIKKMLKVRE
ncbi:MAG: C39 family peptidase [Promethearchaeota archaeon]